MISIIICSRKNQIDQKFEVNISQTIGVDFEFVIIDNADNKLSIFEAYNIGIQMSKGDVLCFIHDDILFHTQDWGNVLQSEFEANPSFVLIGVAGSNVKTQYPTGWWDCEKQYKAVNIIQHNKGKITEEFFGFADDNLQEVLAIDGVFMALKKSQNFLFDTNLKGFHNYDLSLCCKVRNNNDKIGVTKKILIEHFSIGSLNKDWFLSSLSFHKRYFKSLAKNNSTFKQKVFAGKKYIDHCLSILGKKKGFFYLLAVFKFTNSIRINFILSLYLFNRFFFK